MTAIQALQIWTMQYDTRRNEAVCLTFAAILHLLLFLWNPTLLKSDLKAVENPLVEVTVVDMAQGPGGAIPEAPKKMNLIDTLKDMLKKPVPVGEELSHVAPPAAQAPPSQLPNTPALQDRSMAHPLTPSFQPRAQMDDIAAIKSQAPINAAANMAQLPNTPQLKSKSFSGIKSSDLPFELTKAGDEPITGASGAIPVAVGKTSSKEALAGMMNAPTLQQANKTHVGLTQRMGSINNGAGEAASLAAGASRAPAAISGAGSAGVAPSGPATGALSDKAGGGSLIGRKLLNQGSGNINGSGGIITRQQEQANQLTSESEPDRKIAKSRSGDIEGELKGRGVLRKVIPQYPSWAEEQGIVGTLKLFFTVSPEGNVRPNITVRQTTGYPALDQLGIDALKQWKFAPHTGGTEAKDQWGVITFVFSLAS